MSINSMNVLKSYRSETIAGLLYLSVFSKLAVNISFQGLIVFNQNQKYNRLGYVRGLILSELGNLIAITYVEYGNKLLPPPFETKCQSYASPSLAMKHSYSDIYDRGSCYESWIKNVTKEKVGNVFCDICRSFEAASFTSRINSDS